MKQLLAAAFVATVIAANWSLQRFGFVDMWPGLTVPAGVYAAGLGFGIRDALHEAGGKRWVFAAIATGGTVSWFIEPAFAVASAAAFTLSELVDMAIYTPLRLRRWTLAVILSNTAGAIADSLLFLWIAFDTTTGWSDLTIGKMCMVAIAIPTVWATRRALPS